MAARFKASSRFLDSLGAIVAKGWRDRKVLRTGPGLFGISSSLACTVSRVGGNRAGKGFLANNIGMYEGGEGWQPYTLVLVPRRGCGHFDIWKFRCRGVGAAKRVFLWAIYNNNNNTIQLDW